MCITHDMCIQVLSAHDIQERARLASTKAKPAMAAFPPPPPKPAPAQTPPAPAQTPPKQALSKR